MTPPLPRPDFTPRRGLMWVCLSVFALWVGLLTWVYVTQVLLKKA